MGGGNIPAHHSGEAGLGSRPVPQQAESGREAGPLGGLPLPLPLLSFPFPFCWPMYPPHKLVLCPELCLLHRINASSGQCCRSAGGWAEAAVHKISMRPVHGGQMVTKFRALQEWATQSDARLWEAEPFKTFQIQQSRGTWKSRTLCWGRVN